MAYSKIILNGETLMDVTSDTVDAGDLLSGETATKNDGTKVTGNISTVTHPNPTRSFASTTGVFTTTHTQSTGYVTGGTTSSTYALVTQNAQTFYPSTADQTISSYRWLTGSQTIKSVTTSNLTASNIAEGVTVKVGDATNASRITQVIGTHSGATSYTASISGSGNSSYCYVTHNGTKYYSNGNTFSFKAGDTLTIYCRGNNLTINEENQALTNYSYTMTLPIGDIRIWIEYLSSTNNTIELFTYVLPEDTYGISSGGYFNVYGYAIAAVPTGSISIPAKTITTNPTMTLASTTGVVTATYSGSSSITPTITSGYVSNGTAGTVSTTGTSTFQLTSKAAATYYPSTADQTISSYRWLTGTQTIRSVTTSNLTASNIAEGVVVKVGDVNDPSRISQVTGTYTPASTSKRYIGYITSASGSGVWIYNNNDFYFLSGIGTMFNFGDEISIVAQTSGGYGRSIYIDGSFVSNGGLYSTEYTFTPNTNFDISWEDGGSVNISTYTIPTGTLNIESNGDYNVYGYARASVNIGGGGFTADQIAMRTIAGDISGSATNISSYAFYSCTALTTASFPNVTSIGDSAFHSCITLTTVSFPNAISIGNNAFRACHKLTIASFPSVTSIGGYAFAYCSALTIANFSNLSFISDYAFRNGSALTTVSFPSATSTGTYAFQYCSVLSTISFPNMTIIGAYTFTYCYKLTTANFPGVTSIGSQAFGYCSSLSTISFPKVITIGSNAFSHCSILATASFPSVANIFDSAFRSCYNLLSFYLLGSSVPTLSTSVFYHTPIDGYTASTGGVYGSIFVPSSLYNQYIVATNWSDISARIVSI